MSAEQEQIEELKAELAHAQAQILTFEKLCEAQKQNLADVRQENAKICDEVVGNTPVLIERFRAYMAKKGYVTK